MANVLPSQDPHDAVEMERNAYNAAFYELGLRWHWDAETYRQLVQASPLAMDRVRMYLETRQAHLLRAYDVDFLVNAIEAKKAHCEKAMTSSGSAVSPYFNWAETRAGELGA